MICNKTHLWYNKQAFTNPSAQTALDLVVPADRMLERTLICLGLLLTVAPPAPAHAIDGPLQVRNQFPLFLGVMPPYLESAGPRNDISFGLSHSSVYVVEQSPAWTVNMDLELTEFDLRVKRKAGQAFEVGLEIPVIRPAEGFLDGFLEQWHDLLGAGDYGRSERPENEFLYEIMLNGAPVIAGVNGRTGLGDIRLTVKRIMRQAGPAVSVLAGLEVPSGDARTGYGNGRYDASAAILAEQEFAGNSRWTANMGVTVPGDYAGYQTVGLRTFWHGGLGIETAWWSRFSILVQAVAQTSPFPTTGIREVDWPAVLFTFGGRYYAAGGNFEFSLTEDPTTAGAPDFIANVVYTLRR